MPTPHDGAAPSAWVRRWSPLLAPGATLLDVACGSGRHLRWFAERGLRATGIDRDATALAGLESVARIVHADLEQGPWPLPGERFDAVIVTNYLWRPLLPALAASLNDGGVLIYETFALGNAAFGRPRNPEFLLAPGELLRAFAQLRVLAFEDGYLDDPPRCVQRLCALRLDPATAADARLPLLPAAPGRSGSDG